MCRQPAPGSPARFKAREAAHRLESAQHLEGDDDQSGHRSSIHTQDKRAAALIAVFAAFLAFIELGSNSTQIQFIAKSVETADTWAFFQAKTIRKTILLSEKELLERLTVGAFAPALLTWNPTSTGTKTSRETGERI